MSIDRCSTEDRVDEALARIHTHADENAQGFTSHAPMAIDALVALGRADRIEPFLDAYLDDFPAASAAHAEAERKADAWSTRLEADGAAALDRALAELAPSVFAAATHGLIRVAHAVRALDRRDSPVRHRELARALAYWQASKASLPGTPGAIDAGRVPAATLIEHLEVVPNERRSYGLFTEGVAVLADHPPFSRAIERLEIPTRVGSEEVSSLTRAMLAPYFESPLLRIAYIHTITAPSALRLVADHVRPETLVLLYGYGVQAVAALHAISRLPTDHTVPPAAEALAADVESLKSRAADTLEEHVIKFTEACVREHAAAGDERFLLAAADATVAHELRAAESAEGD